MTDHVLPKLKEVEDVIEALESTEPSIEEADRTFTWTVRLLEKIEEGLKSREFIVNST